MRRLSWSVLCSLIVGMSGCADSSPKESTSQSKTVKSSDHAKGTGDFKAKDSPTAPVSGDAGLRGRDKRAERPKEADKAAPGPIAAPTSSPAVVAAVAGTHRSRTRSESTTQAGKLTAGSFDDNLNPDFFRSFADRMVQDRELARLPEQFRGQRLVIMVKGQDGAPVGNAAVRVQDKSGHSVQLTTRTDGRAVFLSTFDGYSAEGELQVEATPPGGGAAVKQTVPGNASRWEVSLPAHKAALPRNLDLVMLIDTTGSMGDELGFLKGEMQAIVDSLETKFPNVNKRYGLVLYRDDGDEYVTRRFPFTSSLADFRVNLSAQSAAGGGDEPEALHRGLEDTVQLAWRDADTARVVFLFTDAPCHPQHIGSTMDALKALRKRGIAVYPVACSGTKDAAEFILRAAGLVTGTQYLFLTDDSGVGNSHEEPHIPFYHVEKLDRLMVRMIAGELSGKRIAPEKKDILRTVGKPIN